MKETILLFNIPEKEKRLKLEMALFPLHVKIKYVKPEEYNQKLGTLAGVKEIPESTDSYTGEELPSTMLVFAFLPDQKLNQALYALKKSGVGPIPYKAVLTPTNQFWTPLECFEEIQREHHVMSKQ